MRFWGIVLIFLLPAMSNMSAQDPCRLEIKNLQLPSKVQMRGRPPVVRWDQVDQTLSRIERGTSSPSCGLKFGEIFQVTRQEVYFPITNNLLRIVPEENLKGLKVFSLDGYPLGEFENTVVFERSGGGYALNSYRLHYFQFRDARGEMQSSGNRHLIDIGSGKPIFVFSWDELKGRAAVTASADFSR